MMVGKALLSGCAALLALLALHVAAEPALAQTMPPGAASTAEGEDGYQLWLRYAPLDDQAAAALSREIGSVELLADRSSPTVAVALSELGRGLQGLTGQDQREGPGGLVLALREQLPAGTAAQLDGAAEGAYLIGRTADGRRLIAANDEIGLLYGSFALLREIQTTGALPQTELFSAPDLPLRMLNHWDNPDGMVERGYSGSSIFDWWHLPEVVDRRMIDYARANASLGINGTVVNNVNASPLFLTERYLPKLKALADLWRPYGIRLYISARFSAPRDVGGLETADPLDSAVQQWWQDKADQIYAEIPDFGGFLVKANSEGEPGPQDYGRTHADGANMMARAIGDRGLVIWRAFVYSELDATDRAMQAYAEFVPLDGQFADNVIVQVKNGPIDFQPREPFHPLFGATPDTRLMFEAQITKEYLGFASHLVYLAPMWEEALEAETGRAGTVAETITDGGMAGVANTGSSRNWTGSQFDQANWYAYGRMAWNPQMESEAIAREWAAQTFSRAEPFLNEVVPMMMGSRQAAVDYMTPLGLTHQMATGHHYGPGPWVCDLARPEWNPCYYAQADAQGIGFDRTEGGSGALGQYAPSVAAQWADPATIDEEYLLWFHHLPWDFQTRSGRPLWEELVARYDQGVAAVDRMAETWADLAPYVDPARHAEVAAHLAIQRREARWWRDASIAYWQSLNNLPLPAGAAPPEHSLDHYKSLEFPEAPGHP